MSLFQRRACTSLWVAGVVLRSASSPHLVSTAPYLCCTSFTTPQATACWLALSQSFWSPKPRLRYCEERLEVHVSALACAVRSRAHTPRDDTEISLHVHLLRILLENTNIDTETHT